MSRYILKASEVGVIIAMTLLTVLILSPTVCSTFNASANYQSERASNIAVLRISVSGIVILIANICKSVSVVQNKSSRDSHQRRVDWLTQRGY